MHFLCFISDKYFQIFGYKKGVNAIEKTNPFFLLISLPAIPYLFVYGRVIKWDETLLRFWRKRSGKFSLHK